MESKSLPSNRKRPAYDAIGGYIYQVYHSLYAWITLKFNEDLFLEVAEDFDIKSPNSFKTNQIKRKYKNITLRSKDVIVSINNYWGFKQQYKHSIKFYFITVANRGYEKEHPFNGIKGLDYWDQCKNECDLSLLKEFLLKLDLGEGLLEFIKRSSDDEIRKELLHPIEWLTGQKDTKNLVIEIKKELIKHGHYDKYTPNDSEKAFGGLLETILEVICESDIENRKLDREDFLKRFQDLLDISIPIRDYKILVNKYLNDLNTDAIKLQPSAINSFNIVKNKLIKPLITDKGKYIFRSKLISESRKILERSNFIQITGSTGTGKTILATQILESEIANWRKLDLKGLKGVEIKETLWSLKENYSYKWNLLIDNIDFGSESVFYEDALEDFILLLKENNKKLIIISHNKISKEFALKINIDAGKNIITTSKFSEEEVRDMLALFSCPKEEIDLWVKDINIVTKSHPQLVHARIISLRETSWNKNRLIFNTEEIVKIRDNRVQKLFSEIPSNDALDFLLRLSILIGNFKKKNALSLSNYPTVIKAPKITFNLLVGPYVEQISDEHFCISPLFENAYVDNFNDNEMRELNRLAGESYLTNTLTPLELSNIILHGLRSDSEKILNFAIMAFNSIKSHEKERIYPYIDWFSIVKIDKKRKIFEKNHLINLMLRQMQFILAAEKGSDSIVLKIVDLWFNELREFSYAEKSKEKITLLSGLFYFNVFRFINLNFPIKSVLSWLFNFLVYANENIDIFNKFEVKLDNEDVSFRKQIIEIALINRINSHTIEEFLDIITSNSMGDQILKEIDIDNSFTEIIINNIWLEESKKINPNWEEIIGILNRCIKIARNKKFKNILVFSIKAKAVIEYEYLNNKEESLKVISEGTKIAGKHQELLNYQAKIAFIEKDYKNALKIWINILPKLSDNISHAIAHRDAFVSAVHCERWNLSEDYINTAISISRENKDFTYEMQCKAEYGYYLWEQKKYPEFIKICDQIIESLPKLPSIKHNLRVLGFYKMFANALLFFDYSINEKLSREDKLKLTQPFQGMFSQLEYSKELKELPIPLFISLWLFLAKIEFKLDLGTEMFQKLLRIDCELPILYKPSVREIIILKSLRDRNILNLVNELVDYFSYMIFTRKNPKRTEFLGEPDSKIVKEVIKGYGSMITKYLVFSLLCYFPGHSILDLPIRHWEIEGIKVGLDKCPEWNEVINSLNTFTPKEASSKMMNSNSDPSLRILACLYLLVVDENNVSRNDSMYASALITTSIKEHFSLFYSEVENNLAKIFAERWTIIASRLFEINKDKKIKKVLDVCKDDGISGIKKAARIVLAANEISIFKVDNLKKELTKLAEE